MKSVVIILLQLPSTTVIGKISPECLWLDLNACMTAVPSKIVPAPLDNNC